ncbi:B9 domain-containing protein 2 isoform X2 [Lucilia cuprina]|uniref:B9 domain-containing protein 2 isoform X2 n=1 Tax=Lucilia cuprina TaxID=7375 RepID=UPI001F054B65|nr:B9 domain-containing protein 2 isoform X2 [Lucilia cuprina]
MAEVHIIGQILKAVDFQEPHIFCKWSLQSGTAWRIIQGEAVGQTFVATNRLESCSDFCQPLDLHLGTASVQGWPKLHVEIHAVNVLNKSWPVGYGFVHIPTKPGFHRLEVLCWKIAPRSWYDSVREKFGGGGLALCKEDLIYSGLERYKLQTRSSGKIIIDINLVFRNFAKFGIEFK